MSPPVFGSDSSTLSATTGDKFTFSIEVTDNIGVSSVFVEYWFGTGLPTNASMMDSNPYMFSITVPSNSTASLNYIFHANDTVNNWDQTIKRVVSVIDNDVPFFGTDGSDTSGTTGENFTCPITVSDNINVEEVYVDNRFNSGNLTNVSMSNSVPYTKNVLILNESQTLNYIFHAHDTAGNWNQTTRNKVSIIDNDAPVFGTDGSDTSGTTGESFSFSIGVTDNIDVTEVNLEYWFGSGIQTNVSLPAQDHIPISLLFHQVLLKPFITSSMQQILEEIGRRHLRQMHQ